MKLLSATLAATVCLSLSCGGSVNGQPDGATEPEDAGTVQDAGGPPVDAGTDAGLPTDGGVPGDAGTPNDGGVPGDAGPTDAGPASDGGAKDSGTPDAGCPYAYCEDFDGYDAGAIANGEHLGPWVATFQGAQTTMAVAASGGYAGTQALRVTIHYVPDGGTMRATLNQHTDGGGALVGNDLFGRAEIFYATDNDAGLPIGVHSWIFNAAGKVLDGGNTSLNMGGGGAKAQLNYQYPKLPDGGIYLLPDGGAEFPTEDSAQGGSITTGTWHCVQWQYDGTPNDFGNVWIDGTPAITVNDPTAKDWILSDAYDSFDFGFTHYQVLANGIDLYLDNFALDGQMIPCP